MKTAPTTVQSLIDGFPLSPIQIRVLFLCFVTVALDGFDNGAMGYVAPSLVRQWGIDRASLGPALSAALVGLAIGALTSGPLADRIGRKPVIVLATGWFGLFALASAFAPSIDALIVLRFLTGLGLGAVMPNSTALAADFCPTPRKAFLVTLTISGFTLGSSLGGLAAAAMIPRYGWPSVFWLGGLAPLLLVPVLAGLLRESPHFLLAPGRPRERGLAVLSAIARTPAKDISWRPGAVAEKPPPSVAAILSGRLRSTTLMLWGAYFLGLFSIYLLTSWLPTLLRDAGFDLPASARITSMFQLGGTAGALAVAWLMDRAPPAVAVAGAYALAAVVQVLAGKTGAPVPLLAVMILAAGFFTSGAQTTMSVLAAGIYPSEMRATGVGWMLGVGRLGAIVGAMAGGPLLAWGLDFHDVFSLLAAPMSGAAVLVALIAWRHSHLAGEQR